MGRKPIGNPTLVVAVDDKILAWSDGHLGGDRELVRHAYKLAEYGSLVSIPLTGHAYTAELDNPENRVGAVAAMMGVKPGRTRLIVADESTIEEIFMGDSSVLPDASDGQETPHSVS